MMPCVLWILMIGMAMNMTLASFLWTMNAIGVHGQLEKSLSVAGMVLMLNSGASVVGNLVGEILFDKIDGFRSMMFAALVFFSVLSLITTFFYARNLPKKQKGKKQTVTVE
jgi:MFS family permease